MKANIFKLFTGIAGIYHLFLGLSGLLLPTELFVNVSGFVLGIRPEVNEKFQLITKFTSAYVLVFGILLFILAVNPIKYRVLAIPALCLFGVRLINKLVFFGVIGELLGVSTGRNIFATICVFFFFIVILLCLPKAEEAKKAEIHG